MTQHEKELILVCWHIGPEVVAKERYNIFLDLGKLPHSPFQSCNLNQLVDADEQDRSRTTPKKCLMPKSTNDLMTETPTAYPIT
jgi:hypothetical protein